MLVSELIEELKNCPQDVDVELAVEYYGDDHGWGLATAHYLKVELVRHSGGRDYVEISGI